MANDRVTWRKEDGNVSAYIVRWSGGGGSWQSFVWCGPVLVDTQMFSTRDFERAKTRTKNMMVVTRIGGI